MRLALSPDPAVIARAELGLDSVCLENPNSARPTIAQNKQWRPAMGHLENPYCMRCGSTEGGQYGHETNECRLGREAEMDAAGEHPTFFRASA